MSLPRLSVFTLLFSFVLGHVGISQAQDQAYKTLPLDSRYDIPDLRDYRPDDPELVKVRAEISQKRSTLNGMLGRLKSVLEDRGGMTPQEVNTFLRDYYFASMTQTTPRKLGEYGNLRNEFFRALATARGPQRLQILTFTLDTMKEIASDNFHPAARVNALIIIGKLDSQRGTSGSNAQAPIPFAPALDFLLGMVERDDTADYLKTAAMSGIMRHAELRPLGSRNELEPGLRNRISALSLKLLQTGANQDSNAGQYWLRRQAAQAMGNLRDAGNGSANAKELLNILRNRDEKIMLRIDAIEAISKMSNLDPSSLDIFEIVLAISDFVVEAAKADANYLDETYRQIAEVASFLDNEDVKTGSARKTKSKKDAGLSGPAGTGDERPGAGQQMSAEDNPEVVPVFRRQAVLQRVKTIIYYAGQILGSRTDENRLVRQVARVKGENSEEHAFVLSLAQKCTEMMVSTNVIETPFTSKKKRSEEAESPDVRTRAEKLRDVLLANADEIEAMLNNIRKKDGNSNDETGSGD